jgi:CelD/BcsL family acetyltransferase involved in cellulose biosynthesis
MIHVREINDIRQLDAYRLTWNALLAETPGASFFHSLDWLETYWRHYGEGQRLRVLVVSSEDRPLGILPLVVRTEPTRVGRLRVLTYPLHDWATFYSPIGPNPTATLVAGLSHIRQTRRDWDLLDLRWVDLDGNDRGRTERAMQHAGFHPHKQAWDQAPIVEFTGIWQDYWKGRNKHFRRNVERCERRLNEQGKVTYVRYRPAGAAYGDGDPRWDLYDKCVELSERSWQGSSVDGTTLCHAEVRDYFRETHAAAAHAGAVDLNLMLISGCPVAFSYNYCCEGNVYGSRKGFDPGFGHLRPGLVLQKMMLEDGHSRGDRVYDLGVGSLDSKQDWLTSTAVSYRFTHFPATVARVQFMRLHRWLQHRIRGEKDVACGA